MNLSVPKKEVDIALRCFRRPNPVAFYVIETRKTHAQLPVFRRRRWGLLKTTRPIRNLPMILR
jgi:hypothetical protein